MKIIKGLKKIYAGLNWYNRQKLLEANCKHKKTEGKTMTEIKSSSKEKHLLLWCGQKQVFSKVDVVMYATRNYYLRADRTIREFVQEGKVRRLDQDECRKRNLKGHMAWYEFVKIK